MATKTKTPDLNKKLASSEVVQDVKKNISPLQAFFTKFNNDWSMNLAAALAYNLMLSIFPIAIALLSILGFILATLNLGAQANLTKNIQSVLPSQVSAGVIDQITTQLKNNAGLFGIIALILAIFNGSRLFILMEGCFGIIYHVRQRALIRQNLMAIGMLLLFVILIPLMIAASSAPAFVSSILQQTPLAQIPGIKLILSLSGILGGLIAAWILFQAIYIVVPNQHISFRNAVRGAIVAAIALELYLLLFPLYVAHFLGSYGGVVSLVILLIFFYYFAVILLLGAEVNAFFGEGITVTPTDLVSMVHIETSHLPKTKANKDQQAAPSHREKPIGSIADKTNVNDAIEPNTIVAQSTSMFSRKKGRKQQSSTTTAPTIVHEGHQAKSNHSTFTSTITPALVAIVGTGLAFLVEWLRLRRTAR